MAKNKNAKYLEKARKYTNGEIYLIEYLVDVVMRKVDIKEIYENLELSDEPNLIITNMVFYTLCH